MGSKELENDPDKKKTPGAEERWLKYEKKRSPINDNEFGFFELVKNFG